MTFRPLLAQPVYGVYGLLCIASVQSTFCEQMLRKYGNHWTTVADEMPMWFVVCATLVSDAQKYIKANTFPDSEACIQ